MRFLKHADNEEKLKSNKFKKIIKELCEVLNIQKNKYIIKENIFHVSFEEFNNNSYIINNI